MPPRLTPRAAQANVDKLVKEDVLEEVTGRQRNRIFRATGIMQILDAAVSFD